MRFKATETINGPIEAVFDDFTDIRRIEQELTDHGVGLERLDSDTGLVSGASWHTVINLRDRRRDAEAHLVDVERPKALRLEGKSGGMLMETSFEFTEVGPNATELEVVVNLRARSVSAKLLLSSFRLARSRMVRGMRKRVAKSARACEARIRAWN
jgi:uncharacterized protein YndB with AHSA1/START domain